MQVLADHLAASQDISLALASSPDCKYWLHTWSTDFPFPVVPTHLANDDTRQYRGHTRCEIYITTHSLRLGDSWVALTKR